jgi:Cysteine rich repeat
MISAMEEHVTSVCHHALQVFDYRNDVILAETCREDVNKFCKKVLKGRCPVDAGPSSSA